MKEHQWSQTTDPASPHRVMADNDKVVLSFKCKACGTYFCIFEGDWEGDVPPPAGVDKDDAGCLA